MLFGRKKGATSILGLVCSVALLFFFIAPNILAGKDPVLVSVVGAGLIAILTIFLSHDLNKRSSLAVVSTLITLMLATAMTYLFIYWSQLFGLGTADAYTLQYGFLGTLSLRGILFAGILIGTLGILDDVTTTQTATVAEIHSANPDLGIKELYTRGLRVGREHIASLINTLVLVYAGSSFPLFLLLVYNVKQPLWTILNSEFVAEELVRTLVGSSSLILAVPISTILAAYFYSKKPYIK